MSTQTLTAAPVEPQNAQEEHDAAVGTLLDLIDAVRDIANIREMNGPSGVLLGAVIRREVLAAGRTIESLTIAELTEILKRENARYNRRFG